MTSPCLTLAPAWGDQLTCRGQGRAGWCGRNPGGGAGWVVWQKPRGGAGWVVWQKPRALQVFQLLEENSAGGVYASSLALRNLDFSPSSHSQVV